MQIARDVGEDGPRHRRFEAVENPSYSERAGNPHMDR